MDLDFLTGYLHAKLLERGFPAELKLYYSLSYCQGDGVAFYGSLSKAALENLLPYLFPNQKQKVRRLKRLFKAVDMFNKGGETRDFIHFYRQSCYYPYMRYSCMVEHDPFDIAITGENKPFHYCHHNSMTLRCLDANEIWYFEESMQTRWYFKPDRLQDYMDLWDEFVDTLKDYIVETSKYLEKLGYEYIEIETWERSRLEVA